MREKFLEHNSLNIWREDGRYWARYDVGAHQVILREDEITEAEAVLAASGELAASEMLFALQARLVAAGVDPYCSNLDPGEG